MMSTNPEEIILYDAIERAVTNVHAALAAIDSAWLGISVERPNPSPAALAALDTADEILAVGERISVVHALRSQVTGRNECRIEDTMFVWL